MPNNNNNNNLDNVYTHPFTKNGQYTNVGMNLLRRNSEIRSRVGNSNLYSFRNKRRASGANRMGIGMTRSGSPLYSRKRKSFYENVCNAFGRCFTRRRR